ncbi:hypothetical protein [Gryllotalpicola protaetiae]|uniref:Uncharacterized protein n=1 Tax=Gryllotalpicola protaetiae TaxID=2419771 RepID=A0A387BYL1_9MICO|nr:hypothetical protein [Gryllotalpicola protaetiae]AYG03431.1 hypothetical protein D7I44_07700 [Gryllotalpicola protaetiae]
MSATFAEIESAILDRSPACVHQRVVEAIGFELPERDIPRFPGTGELDLDLATHLLLRDRLAALTDERLGEYSGVGWRGVPALSFWAHVAHDLVVRGIDPLTALDEVAAERETIRADQLRGFNPSDVATSLHTDVPEDRVQALLAA